MALTDIYIMEKESGKIHRLGEERHDSIWVDGIGIVHYHNLKNGDGCNGKGYVSNAGSGGYAFISSECGGICQPDMCVFGITKCNYPITDCINCPIREHLKRE